jgi:hypothetical protein
MRKTALMIITILFLAGCHCWFSRSKECNDEKYGPVAIRLSEFSSQVIYYYRSKNQAVPQDFDAQQFMLILKQLPPDQIQQKDVDSMISKFKIEAHGIDGGFSVMLCEKNGKKLMEDFASPHGSKYEFALNEVEIKSWNENIACSFEADWQKYSRNR